VKPLAALVAFVAVLSLTRPARADNDSGIGVAIAGAIAGGTALTAGSMIPLIGTSVAIAKHGAARGWGIASVVVGTATAVLGATYLGAFGHNEMQLAVCVPMVAVGGASIGVGIAGIAIGNHRGGDTAGQARLSLVPVGGLDSTGHQMAGVGLRLTM
jgi:hypothetical protein